MTQAAHTPGPWTVEIGDQTRTSEIWAGDMIVADVHGHVTQGSHADAHLIAATPEMLSKLEAWQAVCDRITEQYGGVIAGIDFSTLGRANRATIAKAKGEA